MNEKKEGPKKSHKSRLAIIILTIVSQALVLGGANAGSLVESPITFNDVNINVAIS